MHCEGCAKKVRKCLRGFEGVEDVKTDCKTHIVTVKGKKAAENPLKVLERVQRKSHRKVELLSPIPKPPSEDDKKIEEKKEEPKPVEEKKEEVVIIVVIKVHMHCEACAQEIRKRILRMKGVKEAVPDLKSSQVTVKGVFDPPKLIEYIYKRTGKHAVIVKTEPEKKEEEKKEGEKKEGEGEEKKKEGEGGEKKEGGEGEKKEGGEGEEKKKEGGEEAKPAEGEEKTEKVEIQLMKNEFYYYPPKYNMEYVYPPQIFSDENPNACSVM
ncbi:hypothetical protein MKX01_014359 [Papaver californicum]|nr:hypothetical protein MKX01_014359 [Papaver californicum]